MTKTQSVLAQTMTKNACATLRPIADDAAVCDVGSYHETVQKAVEAAKIFDSDWFVKHPTAKAMRRQPFEGERLLAASKMRSVVAVEVRRRGGMYLTHLVPDGPPHEGEPVELKMGRTKPKGFG